MGSCGGGLTWSRKRVPSLPIPLGSAAWQNSSHRRSQAGRNPPPPPPPVPLSPRPAVPRTAGLPFPTMPWPGTLPTPPRTAPPRIATCHGSPPPPAHLPVLNAEADSPGTALTQLHVPIQRAESEQAGHSEGCHTAPRKLTVTRTSKNAFPVYAEHENTEMLINKKKVFNLKN